VKISIAECGGGTLTGLEPTIRLLNGDRTDGTEASEDVVETYSSSADSTGIMRPVEGGYIYNLRVPTSIGGVAVVANDVLTIRVRPFGDDNPGAGMYVLLKIRK
jgi:hypothetical protein